MSYLPGNTPDVYIIKHHATIASGGLLDFTSNKVSLPPTNMSITLSGPGVSRENWNIFQVIAGISQSQHYYGATLLDGE